MATEEPPVFHWHFSQLNKTDLHFNTRGLFLLLIFFSLIILIATLFLYAHWLCRYRHLSSTTTTTSATVAPLSTPSRLDPDIINSLPIILVTKSVASGVIIETECSICLSLFEDKERVKVLPECNHAYHSECVDKWLSTQSSCPLCRASLRVESAEGTP